MKSSQEEKVNSTSQTQEIVRTPERNMSPGSSPRTTRYSTYVIPTSSIVTTEYDLLSDEIMTHLKERDFDTIIFDFDGTLTKSHTARASKRDIETFSDWFADEMILEQILRKGCANNIKFYIASNQRQGVIETILAQHDLAQYFTEIRGNTSGIPQKEIAIDEIAQNPENHKVLYLDDDPETISSTKVTLIRGLLTTLEVRENPKKRDINGEAGLTFEKWGKIKDCLQQDKYNIDTPSISKPRLMSESAKSFLDSIFLPTGTLSLKKDDSRDASNSSQSSTNEVARNFETLLQGQFGRIGK